MNMTNKSEGLVCKFTEEIHRQGDQHVVSIPETEIDYGTLSAGDIVRIGVEPTKQPASDSSQKETAELSPPVKEGEQLTVEIEDTGEGGDGIAFVGRGYVLIVPWTEPGDTVDVEVTETHSKYGFGYRLDKKEPAE